jgi:hypothetical protein
MLGALGMNRAHHLEVEMRRSALTLILGAALTLSVSLDVAAAPAKVTKQVHVLLNAPEYVPSAQEWKALGPDAAEVLREVALDKKVLVLKRGRAAIALTNFKNADSKAVLTQLVANDKVHWILRGKAAYSMATSFGSASLAHVEPLLAHKNHRMREAAVKAVGLVKTKESKALLEARLKIESKKHIRALLTVTVVKINKVIAKGGAK